MLDPARLLPPGLLCTYRASGGYRKGLLRDETEGGFGSDGFDLVAGLAEATYHARRLVRGDPARYPDEYLLAVLHGRKYI